MPYTHRKVKGKQCVYKKSTGKKVGCTTGSLQKYLAALAINANESKTFKNKKKYTRKGGKGFNIMYEQAMSSLGVIGRNTSTPGQLSGPIDTSFTAEGEYAQGQDYAGIPAVQSIADAVDKDSLKIGISKESAKKLYKNLKSSLDSLVTERKKRRKKARRKRFGYGGYYGGWGWGWGAGSSDGSSGGDGGGGGESYHGMRESITPTKAMYTDKKDQNTPAVQSIGDAVDKDQLVMDIIGNLEELKSYNWSKPLNDDVIEAMAMTLKQAGIEPTDFYAAIGASPEKQQQYLLYGPSSWKGGKGALNDLKAILYGNEPEEITNETEMLTPEDIHSLADEKNIIWDNDPAFMKLTQELTGKKHLDSLNQKELRVMKNYLEGLQEDESNPAAALPMGTTTAGTAASPGDNIGESTYKIGEVILDNPYGTGRKHFQGIDRIEAVSEDDALNKYIRQLVVSKKIPTNPKILYRNAQKNNVSVIKIEDSVAKPSTYWWQDKD